MLPQYQPAAALSHRSVLGHWDQQGTLSHMPVRLRAVRLRLAGGADCVPDALGRRWQLDMLDAKFGKRVDDRVRYRGEPRRDPTLAAAAHAERVSRRWNLADLRVESWQQVGARQRIIQERAGQQLAGSRVVDARLP